MGLNGLLGSNDGFSSNFGGVAAAGVWMIVSVILAILVVLFYTLLSLQSKMSISLLVLWLGYMISLHSKKCY